MAEAPKEVWVAVRPEDLERGWTNNSTYFAPEWSVHPLNELVRYVRADTLPSPEARGQWIACAERMPPGETDVLVGRFVGNEWRVCQSGYYYEPPLVMEGEPGGWFWSSDYDSGDVTADEGPTHWQPLPAPPVAATQEESR